MNSISPLFGYLFLFSFGFFMILITYLYSRYKKSQTKEDFLVGGRKIGWFMGGTTIAASWIWAPALFISVQVSYQNGLAGLFWFTAPNVLALALFAFFAPQIRKKMPEGYTLPEFIKHRLKSNRVHKIYLFPYFFYQLMAIAVQLFAGGSLVSLLTGISLNIVMPILALIALSYTLISGLKASVITDFIQLSLIFLIGSFLIPLTIKSAGGFSSILEGLGGLNNIKNIFDPGVAFSFGIVTSIGLLAGAISDQQYWQRAFSIKRSQLSKSFLFGAFLFMIVPLSLSILGFLSANPALGISLPLSVDQSMIGVQAISTLLPSWAVFLFVIMLLAGLSSTLDSALSATSTLWVTDVKNFQSDSSSIKSARIAMLGITILGLIVALAVLKIPGFGLKHLWWIFNTIAACVAVPTILALYWDNLNERGVFWGVLISFTIGIPLFVYSNILNNSNYIVGSSLLVIFISTSFCFLFPVKKQNQINQKS